MKISSNFVAKYKDQIVPWGPVGYITYKRTYARYREDLGRTEEWHETIERCCNGILELGGIFTQEEIETLFHYCFNLKCVFTGRHLWQLGSPTVEKIGMDSLQNCWHIAINDPVKPFCFTFNELMLGGGVGFNVTPEYVYELPKVKYNVKITRLDERDVDFIVPDNREGWIELLQRILEAFFYNGKDLTYSTICIRSKGKAIRTFGGTASGSENLVSGMERIVKILQSRVNLKLRPVDCLDILNIIGDIVVAGNVRRSAQLAVGSMHDAEFLNAKNWKQQQIPNWRSMSNNSLECNDTKWLPDSFWEGYQGEGEPLGLINIENCKKYGRLNDGENYRLDPRIVGPNPCGEILLESGEACNLAEIFLPNLRDQQEFRQATELMYKVCKTVSSGDFIYPETNEVVTRNQRLGISTSGILQGKHLMKADILNNVYWYLEDLDKRYSKKLNCNESIKLTTVKPSGTVSLLAGVTPGIHPAYAEYYIRRIRFSSSDPLVEYCKSHGYHVEPKMEFDGSRDLNTMIVSFPIKTPKDTTLAKDLSAVQQLENQLFMQRFWSDNAVSMTCYYRKEELPEIQEWLRINYKDNVKTCSFLLHLEHGFNQAPYEEITEKQFLKSVEGVENMTKIDVTPEVDFVDELECVGGSCPIR